ncbi:ribosomal protection-like ABC-F family protein [Loigolactobacillus backii]|uniref:ABC-F type ribosomal protection protein n=1 Tax=Loigolactobacillus backii TaxID=375175 RepID=A0A192H0P9_9LACO|nr:ABC-F type ribosomal protection protein [Loigolactobacillus backii]ANK61930.1 ABC-F type ribosomal protection protein [Loigolactobacillus backii]ANK65453.1 ABC-F type ribosomal protection protein [Loigolactobacillus backii]ANK68876.1 ABC-F type ribosomal protection protein [Loigolactobacillus backii]MDA5386875.1 ABC-F type ribosomal protection protein [Loigolactobacillus backii]MDA5389341.1 ABC-F type ribosomal protection protein [Loigolactobacillus backii]
MGTIQIQNLNFHYPDMATAIFKNTTLKLDASWKLGLIGRNGRGKTTLLRLLLGQLTYDGQIITDQVFTYFPQKVIDTSLPFMTILQTDGQIDLGEEWQVERECELLAADPEILYRPYRTLSPGEQTKVGLAALFADNTHFQLIDEPTNHLDQSGREIVAKYLQKKQGFIVISHDRLFLNQVIDHTLAIERAQITVQQGNYSTWQQAKKEQEQFEQRTEHKLRHDIKRLEQTSAQKKQWSKQAERGKYVSHKSEEHANLDRGFVGHRAAKVMKRSLAIQKRSTAAVKAKKQLLQNVEETDELPLNYQPERTKQALLTIEQLVVKQQQPLNQPLTFSISPGERLVLSGANGTGKSTILKAILGEQRLIASGNVNLATSHYSYLAQRFSELTGSLSEFAAEKQVDLTQLLTVLRKLGFERQLFSKRIEQFSMGQKRKVALARSLCEPAELYVWDEPLNYLDVLTREQIQQLVLDYQPAMLLVDHDRMFTAAVATQKIELKSIS